MRTPEATCGAAAGRLGAVHGVPATLRWVAVMTALAVTVFGVQLVGHPVSACDSIVMSTIDIQRCIISGDQSEIDAGNAVRVDRISSDTVHWIAGHRTTHGATFGLLTNLQVGDVVYYRDARYKVVEYRLVDRYQPGDVAAWIESPTPTVVLQTSKNDTFVHLWRATQVAPPTRPSTTGTSAPTPFEPDIRAPQHRADRVTHRTITNSGSLKYM